MDQNSHRGGQEEEEGIPVQVLGEEEGPGALLPSEEPAGGSREEAGYSQQSGWQEARRRKLPGEPQGPQGSAGRTRRSAGQPVVVGHTARWQRTWRCWDPGSQWRRSLRQSEQWPELRSSRGLA